MSSYRYLQSINAIIDQIVRHESEAIASAARCCADAIAKGGVLHCFGTGHSALLAADTFYRAGGLACLNAILEEPVSVYAGSLIGSWGERQPGLAGLILNRYDLRAGEPIIIFSVSGVNCVPVEVAAESRARGLTVIAITSRAFCESVASREGFNRTAITEADLVIDNHVPVGDAVLAIQGSELLACPSSTIAATLIYNLILERISDNLVELGVPVPIFASANLSGADEHNKKLIARYRHRIRHF
jgi:uncharacterized phosphosugar-binding protein